MGHTSQSGQAIFATQTAPKVPVSAGDLATDGLSIKYTSGNLAGNRDLLTPDPEIGAGRDTSDAYLGAVSFSGDFEMYARLAVIALFLRNALGQGSSATVASTTGAWKHTITPTDGQIPFMTVYEEISDGVDRYLYSDVVVNTFHLEADANGYLRCTVGLIGRLITAGVSAIDGSEIQDNTFMIVGTNITVRYDNVVLPAKSFSFDVNNNVEDDNFYLGSFFLGDLTAKTREVTASVTVRHEDASMIRQSLFGTPSATQIGGLTTKKELKIVAATYEDVIDAATGLTAAPPVKGSLTLTIPKAIYEPATWAVSGDDALENDISIRALRPDSAVPIVTAEVINGYAAIH